MSTAYLCLKWDNNRQDSANKMQLTAEVDKISPISKLFDGANFFEFLLPFLFIRISQPHIPSKCSEHEGETVFSATASLFQW